MATAQVIGIPSANNIPQGVALRVHGNIWADSGGTTNPNGIIARFIGNLIGYHNISGISGFPGGFATTADHQHFMWIVSSEANEQAQQWQEIYTSTGTGCAFVSHGRAGGASGSALANEHSIDTTGTVALPSAPSYIGRVKFRFTAAPSVTVGQVVIVTISTVQVAGIQAAQYTGTIATGPTLVSGLHEIEVDMEGLDPVHWNAANAANTSVVNNLWSISPLGTALGNKASIASVPGDATAVDVTFSPSVPAAVVVGQAFSLLLRSGTTLTGLVTDLLYTASVQSISGLVVRFRIKNQRFNRWQTIGGSDATPSRFDLIQGVRDMNHDIPVGMTHSLMYRNSSGVPTGWIFGASDMNPSVTGSLIFGSGLVCQTSNQWLAGTSTSNFMSLLGNVLSVNGLNVGGGTNIARIRHGRATLVGGTVTVSDTTITANSTIFPTHAVDGGTPGWLRVSSRIAGTSFTITSSSGTDTSQVDYVIVEP